MKNYVKEYDGQKVPEGATEVSNFSTPQSIEFYRIVNGEHQFFNTGMVNPVWCRSVFNEPNKHAIPLPEQTMPSKAEWDGKGLPPVGASCEFIHPGITHWEMGEVIYHLNGKIVLNSNKIIWEETHGIAVIAIDSELKFRPLKTAEEKKREAFVNLVRKELFKIEEILDFVGDRNLKENSIAKVLFDAGFTAPEGEV